MEERLIPEINLLDYWRILVKRRWVVYACLAALVTTVTLGSLLKEPVFTAMTRLQIERNSPNVLPFGDVAAVSPNDHFGFLETQYELIQSRGVARQVIASLDLARHEEFQVKTPEEAAEAERIDRFLEMLRVVPVGSSRLVDIRFSSHDPVLCARVANRVAETYIAFNSEAQYNTSARATISLALQIANLQEQIDAKEKNLQDYARRNEIIPLSDSQNITLKNLNDLNDAFTRSQALRIEKQARYAALKEAGTGDLPEVLQSKLLQNLAAQLVELEGRRAQLAEKVRPGWPEMVRLERAIQETADQIQAGRQAIYDQVLGVAKSAFLAARNEEEQLRTALEEQKKRVQDLSLKEIRYNNLKSETANRRTILEALVKREAETSTSAGINDLRMGNIRIVDPAEVPSRPTSPRLTFNIGFSLLVGLMFGVMLALFCEYLDKSIKNPEEMQQATGVPFLALIPARRREEVRIRVVKGNGHESDQEAPVELISYEKVRSKLSEAFRELRTALLVSQPGGPPRTILITSGQVGEGKTSVSLNLAIVLAQIGKRVLLVDADMRKSRLHKLLRTFNDHGLSSLLSVSGPISLQPFRTQIGGLDVLPSGPHPPNPADLLDSDRFAQLRDAFLQKGYDHILFDSPPVLAVADPAIIAGRVDGVVLVAQAGRTSRDALRHTAERLQQVKARLIGAVLNRADLAEQGYYRYGHAYKYRDESEPAPPEPPDPPLGVLEPDRGARRPVRAVTQKS